MPRCALSREGASASSMIFRMETRMTSEHTRELPDTVENAAATPGQDMPWM